MSDDSNITGRDGDSVLVAEYVLGLLPEAERTALRARLKAEPALQSDLSFWRSRLASLDVEFAESTAPASVWPRIEQRLFAGEAKPGFWNSLALWRSAGRSLPGSVYWASTFELLARKEVDTWDGQLVLASMVSGQLTATSNVNLIENIGFGELATHTVEDRDELQPIEPITLPTSPVDVVLDAKADTWTRKNHFRATWRGMLDQADRYLKRRKGRAT